MYTGASRWPASRRVKVSGEGVRWAVEVPVFLLFVVAASAGKLAEGFLGVPYGDATVLEAGPPIESCKPGLADGIRWFCDHTIGTARVKVAFMVSEGLYTSTMISGDSLDECQEVAATFKAAYGEGTPKYDFERNNALAERTWFDGAGVANFIYYKYSHKCDALISNLDIHKLEESRRAERAKAATSGL
jgi:hypothetical protein